MALVPVLPGSLHCGVGLNVAPEGTDLMQNMMYAHFKCRTLIVGDDVIPRVIR